MNPKNCFRHQRELLRFLLLKTAVVRSGVKPGELLQLRRCPGGRLQEAREAQDDPCRLDPASLQVAMKLDFCELRAEGKQSLVLFYHPQAMARALADRANRALLHQCGYPADGDAAELLAHLRQRFRSEKMPHEVGIFLGYPAKDVAGFIARKPRTPVPRARWAVYGSAAESLRRMDRHRRAETAAAELFDRCGTVQNFIHRFAGGALPAELHPAALRTTA